MGLILFSNQPGLHFYTGNAMDNYYVGKYARTYGNQYGLCLEPELFPNAINHKNFISPILRKGEKYNSLIIMKFRNDF
jgi:aldose 1-epimerase